MRIASLKSPTFASHRVAMYAVFRKLFRKSLVLIVATVIFISLSLLTLTYPSLSFAKLDRALRSPTFSEIKLHHWKYDILKSSVKDEQNTVDCNRSRWDKNCCTKPHCTNFLDEIGTTCVDWCNKRVFINKTIEMTGECRFMRGEGRAPVALASLPGSGNTWVRGLLERATGICTGSMYCDHNLRRVMFNAEGVRTGSVLVVKTHRTRYRWTAIDQPEVLLPEQIDHWIQPKFGAIIVLVRNPYQAMVSEWNRKHSNRTRTAAITNNTVDIASHLGVINNQHFFGGNVTWRSFIKKSITLWIEYITYAILQSPETVPKLVVRYEDFQMDRVREVSRMLDFLNFSYSLDTLSQRLEEDFSVFHRKKHPQFQVFTPPQEQFIERSLRDLLEKLSKQKSETFGIEKYCRNVTTSNNHYH